MCVLFLVCSLQMQLVDLLYLESMRTLDWADLINQTFQYDLWANGLMGRANNGLKLQTCCNPIMSLKGSEWHTWRDHIMMISWCLRHAFSHQIIDDIHGPMGINGNAVTGYGTCNSLQTVNVSESSTCSTEARFCSPTLCSFWRLWWYCFLSHFWTVFEMKNAVRAGSGISTLSQELSGNIRNSKTGHNGRWKDDWYSVIETQLENQCGAYPAFPIYPGPSILSRKCAQRYLQGALTKATVDVCVCDQPGNSTHTDPTLKGMIKGRVCGEAICLSVAQNTLMHKSLQQVHDYAEVVCLDF